MNADIFEMIGASDIMMSYNLYAYCENNPICRIERTGMFSVTITRGILALILDTLAIAFGWSVWFSPISTYVSTHLKKDICKNFCWESNVFNFKYKSKKEFNWK